MDMKKNIKTRHQALRIVLRKHCYIKKYYELIIGILTKYGLPKGSFYKERDTKKSLAEQILSASVQNNWVDVLKFMINEFEKNRISKQIYYSILNEALGQFCRRGDLETVKYLVNDLGISPIQARNLPIRYAIQKSRFEIVDYLLQFDGVDLADGNNETFKECVRKINLKGVEKILSFEHIKKEVKNLYKPNTLKKWKNNYNKDLRDKESVLENMTESPSENFLINLEKKRKKVTDFQKIVDILNNIMIEELKKELA